MVRGNDMLPNGHFHKKWQFHVKTWFNQPARKQRRRNARAEKAKATFPRPVAGSLKPIVRCQTVKYNTKQRLGRGFTLEELKEAGIPAKFAPTVGIAVDHRRKNRSLETLQANVQRLKTYRASLVIFPRNMKKPKAFEASAADCSAASQAKGELLPLKGTKPALELVKITADMKEGSQYGKLRIERVNARLKGMREKRAADEAAKKDDK
uniref:Large ribosomal subunit protein eL13 n=1 Tax=Chlamydomonas sp. (strain W80) TaxID=103365 RepID=RL13_CHLSW|nr:RecName: Full=Large ribosomal subunit protein eL13; AltName: Full=60S ribosomal protein L13; AltName: Full=BBC1 protein homolog [Chlamydomonas sp. W80]BAA23724.1 BBC1 protein [Chlamydomonas sp. W80]